MRELENIERHIQQSIENNALSDNEAGLIRDFITDLTADKDISLEWVKNKYHLLFRMVQIIHSSTGKHLDEITTPDFKKTVSAMRKAEYSDNYRRQLVSIMKGVALYLAEHGHDIAPDKVNKVKLPKKEWKTKTADEMLTREDIFTAIEASLNPRDSCLVAMLFDSSCRSIELLNLKWSDIVFDDRGVKFSTNRKTGYKRTIRLTFSIPYLVKWRDQYPGSPEGDNLVFITIYRMDGRKIHRPMTKDALDRVMIRLRERTGITKLKPGIFRPSRISADVQDGYELPYIMLKNWGNLKTGMIDLYANISGEYMDRQALEMAGMEKALKVEKRRDLGKLKPLECPHCGFVNVPTAGYCIECGRSMTAEAEDEEAAVRRFMSSPAKLRRLADLMEKEGGQE
jgi:integrase